MAEMHPRTRPRQSDQADAHNADVGAQSFWSIGVVSTKASPRQRREAFTRVVGAVAASTGVALFQAVELGVPAFMVDVIAGGTGEPAAGVMDILGVSPTTFRRRAETDMPLPAVAGHRLMGYLRIAALLRRLLDESGDPAEALTRFDVDAWLVRWMREPQPALADKTPAEMLRNPEGQRVVEELLERMRGGLPA